MTTAARPSACTFNSPARAEKSGWTSVGMALFGGWSIRAVSDGHGRFNLTNLPAGEYTVCALMPSDTQDSAARVCLGNTFRRKDARTVKVQGRRDCQRRRHREFLSPDCIPWRGV